MQVCYAQHIGSQSVEQPNAVLINQTIHQHEDHFDCVELEPCLNVLLAMADGLSARPSAAHASHLLLELLVRSIHQRKYCPRKLIDGPLLREIHQSFCSRMNLPQTQGAASTLAALQICRNKAVVVNSGDSRVYRIRPSSNGTSKWWQVSRDHDFLNDLRDERPMIYSAPTPYIHANRHEEDFALHCEVLTVEPGDAFLFTTRGVQYALSDCQLESLHEPKLSPHEQLTRWHNSMLGAGLSVDFSMIYCRIQGIQCIPVVPEDRCTN